MQLFWTETAEKQLDGIYNFIALDSRMYALKMVQKLTDISEQISHSPYSGRIVPEYQSEAIREIIVAPYRVIYTIDTNSIYVTSVIHSATNLT